MEMLFVLNVVLGLITISNIGMLIYYETKLVQLWTKNKDVIHTTVLDLYSLMLTMNARLEKIDQQRDLGIAHEASTPAKGNMADVSKER